MIKDLMFVFRQLTRLIEHEPEQGKRHTRLWSAAANCAAAGLSQTWVEEILQEINPAMAKPKRTRGSGSGHIPSIQDPAIRARIISAIKEIWSRYSIEKKNIKEAAKVKVYKTNKDGSQSKAYNVFGLVQLVASWLRRSIQTISSPPVPHLAGRQTMITLGMNGFEHSSRLRLTFNHCASLVIKKRPLKRNEQELTRNELSTV
jgi:hypothetical protein